MELVDPTMKDYGYCCGRQYVFLPPANVLLRCWWHMLYYPT